MHRRILLTPRAEQSLSDWARHHPPQALALMIGPEGGFTDAEENLASRKVRSAIDGAARPAHRNRRTRGAGSAECALGRDVKIFPVKCYAAIFSTKPISAEDINLSISTRISMRSSTVPRPIR